MAFLMANIKSSQAETQAITWIYMTSSTDVGIAGSKMGESLIEPLDDGCLALANTHAQGSQAIIGAFFGGGTAAHLV